MLGDPTLDYLEPLTHPLDGGILSESHYPYLQHGITGSVHEMPQVWSYIAVSYKNSVIYTASLINNYRGIIIYILTYFSKLLLYIFYVQRFIPYDIVMLFSKVLHVLKGMPS